VTTLLAGTADAPSDYTVKTNIGSLQSATVYYYRFQTLDASVTSNVGKFKTVPDAKAKVAVHFAVSGDCDGLIRPYALASQVPAKNLDFFMFDGDTEYETSASIGSPAVTSTGNIPDPTVTVATATDSQLFTDFSRKYREQFLPVNVGGQNCLQPFFAGQGNYTAYDNHELGNKQYINGGAPAGAGVGSTTGMPPFDFMTGAGVDARVSSNDVTPSDGSVPFMNKSGGFQRLQQVSRTISR
jgi:phosphodiesterase/alkaline phosphatase D-like protein